MQWDMEGDSAFVTGGGSGIGQAIALKLAEQGVKVAVADVDAAKAEGTASRIGEGGGTALALELDVTRSDRVNEAIARTHAEFGSLAYLMNVAGISQQKAVHEISDQDWARMIDVHLNGTFYCIRAALPLMMEAGFGVIASLSSMHGLKGPGVGLPLLRGQGRHRRPHQGGGARGGRERHPNQRAGPGAHRHAHVAPRPHRRSAGEAQVGPLQDRAHGAAGRARRGG